MPDRTDEERRDRRIRRLISTMELAGIPTSREQAERAVDDAAKRELEIDE